MDRSRLENRFGGCSFPFFRYFDCRFRVRIFMVETWINWELEQEHETRCIEWKQSYDDDDDDTTPLTCKTMTNAKLRKCSWVAGRFVSINSGFNAGRARSEIRRWQRAAGRWKMIIFVFVQLSRGMSFLHRWRRHQCECGRLAGAEKKNQRKHDSFVLLEMYAHIFHMLVHSDASTLIQFTWFD